MKQDAILSNDPEAWIDQTFDVPAVRNGGILRTSLKAVEAGAGMARFKAEVNRRQFRALENNGHIIVFCNLKAVEILASGPGNASR
ncbi:hypothetical protein A8B78_15840 [Jannaschia sp. EhC01]|nr:hypothetical protein A8B78_15840 [Jannaschia sp. EhC01]